MSRECSHLHQMTATPALFSLSMIVRCAGCGARVEVPLEDVEVLRLRGIRENDICYYFRERLGEWIVGTYEPDELL